MAEHREGEKPNGPQGDGSTHGSPGSERRASHRVKDDQQSGEGSLSALSKFKMLQRKRAALRPAPGDD